jgi:predicted nucleotidyltransferase
MRLELDEIRAIREAARAVFGPQARVRVFGSRVHDHLKGGDLDLHLEVEPGQATFANEMSFRDLIEGPLDELKVDVVLHERGAALAPIALRDGILL